jgi:hypothetical protein
MGAGGGGGVSTGVKRPGREVGHSTPSSVEVKNEWSYTSIPQVSLYDVVLRKHRDKFTCSFLPIILVRSSL